MAESKNVLLVGGAGYVGSVLAGHLLECGYRVRCLDNLLYGHGAATLPYLGNPKYELRFGNLNDQAVVTSALSDVSSVVILAGLVGDPITKKYPDESEQVNRAGILGLISFLEGKGLERVVFTSTCSNYGLIPEDQLAEETSELRPLSLYAKAKVEVEKALLARSAQVDYCPVILRFATAFGLSPRMRFDLTVSEFTREMFLRRELTVFDIHTWRPYCHVRDLSEAVRRALEAPTTRVRGQVFNVGADSLNSTKKQIVELIQGHLPGSPVIYREHGSDPRNYRVSFAKIRRELGFEPAFTLDAGVRELVAALENHVFSQVDAQKRFFGNYEFG